MKLIRTAGRYLAGVTVAAACVLLTGCVKDKILVKVNKDGSGQIVVTRLFPRETAEQLMSQMEAMAQGMAMSMGAAMGGGDVTISANDKDGGDPFFNEKNIKKEAKSYGPGVRYVKARPVRVGGTRGYVALYRFKDINDVSVDLASHGQKLSAMNEMQMTGGGDADEVDAGPDNARSGNAYGFRFTAGSPAKLIITSPDTSKEAEGGAAPDDGAEETPAPGENAGPEGDIAEAMEMMQPEMMSEMGGTPFFNPRMMMEMFSGVDSEEDMAARMWKGMELSFVVEVEGKPVKTTATYRDPKAEGRVILLDVNMDKILENPAAKKKMKGMNMYGGGSDNPLSAFGKMPGALVETNREVVVEFN